MKENPRFSWNRLLAIFNITVISVILINFAFDKIQFSDFMHRHILRKFGLTFMKYRIGLSDPQTERIQKLRDDFLGDIQPLAIELKSERGKLIQLIMNNSASNDEIEARRKTIQQKQELVQKRIINHILAMKNELTPEQRKQFFKIMARRMGTGQFGPVGNEL